MIDKNALISIIIPTYNRAGLIGGTIQSILEQTYSNWELIIVDDGSTDNTEYIVSGINDDRIQFIKAGRIGIGGKIKNLGLAKANGEYIAFDDADDLWDKTKLEKQITALHEFPGADFCLTGGYNFKTTNEPVDSFYKQKNGYRFGDIFTSIFSSEVAVFTQALLFRKKCLDVVGYFKEEKSFSDFDFIISLAKNFKAVIVYEPLVFRRLHDENYISSTWEKSYYEGIDIIEQNKKELPAKIYENALFKLYTNFGESCLRHKEKRKALGKFLKSWPYKPASLVPLKKIIKTVLQIVQLK